MIDLHHWKTFHQKIEEMIKNTIFHMMKRKGLGYLKEDEAIDYFRKKENVEDFVKELQSRAGDDVEIEFTAHRDNMFDITVNLNYNFEITDIGLVIRE